MKHILVILLLVLPSCIPTKNSHKKFSMLQEQIHLCVEIPKNNIVFENISPMLYEVLWKHFSRVGFLLVDKKDVARNGVKHDTGCYSLGVEIKNVDTNYKFLSPDLLSYASKVKIELLCKLYNRNNELCAQKLFIFRTLISNAKDFVENSTFTDYEYRRLFERNVHKIDQYFRPLMLKRV